MRIIFFSLLIVALLIVLIVGGCSGKVVPLEHQEQSLDCPHGEINCEYPGNCENYIDLNNNGICDHSE